MVSAVSGELSNLASSDSGRAARFGGGLLAGGDESVAAPAVIVGHQEEPAALEDFVEGPELPTPTSLRTQ